MVNKKKATKKPVAKGADLFVVRLVEDPSSEDPSSMYYTESGQGFTDQLGSATRYTEDRGIHKIGEILHESKVVCELVNVSVPYESPVKVGTAILHSGMRVVELIMAVPQIKGGSLTLVSHTGTRELRIQDFLEAVYEEDLQVLWDPELSMVPEYNEYYLEAHGFLHDDGVKE